MIPDEWLQKAAQRLVDDFILVSEDEIGRAIAFAWKHDHERIEGSAAVSPAAALSGRVTVRPALVILSGGNIQPEVHQEICTRWSTEVG